MGQRKTPFVNNEVYHIFNRGVDKREIFADKFDYIRFVQGLVEFNKTEAIGSIYEQSFKKKGDNVSLGGLTSKLVEIIAYCINPNHFHLIVSQKEEKGIEKFMQRIGTGYTRYFNNKFKRNGSLFQGTFKSVHVDNNEYLLYLSAYVNLNDKIHKIENSLGFSSLSEYKEERISGICQKELILNQFKNKKEYGEFLDESLNKMKETKEENRELDKYLLEE